MIFLPFRLAKYDRIPIRYAQQSDLDWQSEQKMEMFRTSERDTNKNVIVNVYLTLRSLT